MRLMGLLGWDGSRGEVVVWGFGVFQEAQGGDRLGLRGFEEVVV